MIRETKTWNRFLTLDADVFSVVEDAVQFLLCSELLRLELRSADVEAGNRPFPKCVLLLVLPQDLKHAEILHANKMAIYSSTLFFLYPHSLPCSLTLAFSFFLSRSSLLLVLRELNADVGFMLHAFCCSASPGV